jgi:hypothetical protein
MTVLDEINGPWGTVIHDDPGRSQPWIVIPLELGCLVKATFL